MASRIEISWNDAVLTVYDTTVYNPVPAEGLPITVKYNGGVLFNGIIQPNGNISVSCSTGTDGLPASGIYSVEINGEENVYSISYERPTKVISFLLDGFNSKLTVKDATQYVGITTYEMACQSPNGNTTQSSNPQVVLTPVYSGLYDVGVTVSVHLSGAGYDITDTYTNKSEYRVYRVEKDALFEAVENFLSVFDSSETRRRKVMKLNIFQDEYERAIQQGDNVGAYGYLVKMAIELGMVGEDGLELPVVTVEQSGSHTHTNLDVLSKLSDVSGSLYYNGSSIGADGRIKLSSSGSYDYISNLIDDSLRVSGDILGISPSGLLSVLYGIDGASSGIDADMLDGKHASAFALTTHTHDGVYSPVGHTHSYEPLISKQNGYLTYLSGAWVFKNEQYALANHTHTDYYTKSELQTSGASSVHWNNITSKPLAFSPAAHGSTHTSSGGDSIPVFTMGQSGLVPPGVTSDRFLRGDGVWAYITTESGDYLDMVKRMVVDNTYDPSPATTGDRYIVLTTTLHANFGTINKDLSGNTLTLGVNDIVQYNGSEFRIAFDASAAMQSATVMVLYDKWGNENHTWTYNISTDQWVDRGAAGQHNSLSGLNVGDYQHLTQYQLSGLTTGIETTLHKHSISYITNLQTTLDGKVPTSRTINGKALSANIVLTVSDIGAAASSHTHTPSEVGLGNVTNDAQLKRSGNDWLGFGSKSYINFNTNDRFLIEDYNSSYVKKYTTLSDIKSWISNNITVLKAFSLKYDTPEQPWGVYDYFNPVFTNGKAYLTTQNNVPTLTDYATKLATARTINGKSFDGSANITTSIWGTSRTITIGSTGKAVDGSGNVSWSLEEIGAAATSHTHIPSAVGLGNVTNDAQLKRSGNDWLGFGSKSYINLNTNDRFLIEDYNSSYVKKYTTLSDIKSWISNNITVLNAFSLKYDTPDQQWGVYDYFNPVFNNGKAYLTTQNSVPTLTDYATKLATARTINGTSFDGSANITTSLWGTSRTITIGSTGKSVDGSANVSWTLEEIGAAATSHTHSNYTPFASNSQTIPMNTPNGAWYRIATSVSGVGRNDGIFELELSITGQQRLSFRASSMYNYDNSIQIVKMGGSKYKNDNTFVIQSVRVVYYPNTYSGVYAYVEVFVTNPNTTNNATLTTRLVDAIGWGLTTGAGSIPTNYVAYDLSVMNYNPFYNTNDKRNVITPSSGVLNIDLRLARNETVVSNIIQNTTINISGLYDGAAGTILLYLDGTYTITLGTMTNDVGNAVYKHTSGTFSSLAAGYYIIAYRVLPDASGTWRVFISISPKYS